MRVANIRTERCDLSNPLHFYCGRWREYYKPGQPFLGNPCPVPKYSREEAIKIYRPYLWERMKAEPGLCLWLEQLPENAVLFCHCAPLACHCSVIISAAQWAKAKPARASSTGIL